MPNLIDKLISKVDTIRQRAADRFGLPAYDLYRVYRTWSNGEVGNGTPTDVNTVIYPTPRIELTGSQRLEIHGRVDDRKMRASEVSLTYTENYLQGDPKAAGEECFYMLVERNAQGADTTFWQLTTVPKAMRDEINWVLEFQPYLVC